MKRSSRLVAVAAAITLTAGLAACAPPSGGGGGAAGPVLGCFDSVGVGSYKIHQVGGAYYMKGYGTRGCVPDGDNSLGTQVWRSSNQLVAEAICAANGGSGSTPQYIGNLLVPAQSDVHRCV